MKNNKSKIIVVIAVLAVVFVIYLYKNHKSVTESNEIAKNIKDVEAISKRNVSEIEEKLKKVRAIHNIKPVTVSNRRYFEDSLFLGDSVTEPLASYEILSSSNVLAKVGGNLITAKSSLDQVNNLNPQRVFFLYGLNDLIRTDSADQYISDYKVLIDEVKKRAPNAQIILISVLPVSPAVQAKNSKLTDANILLYNSALSKFAKENKYIYIDATSVIKSNPNFYEQDGEHLVKAFYPIYLDVIKTQYEENKDGKGV